jgi:hypothetical protein
MVFDGRALVEERDGLRAKLVALGGLIEGRGFGGLAVMDKHLLLTHAAVLKSYLHVLDARIDRLRELSAGSPG